MANYLDGIDGGKHSSEETVGSFFNKIKTACTLSGEYRRKNAPYFLKRIDWKLLREQKLDVLYVIRDLEYEAKEAGSAGEEELRDDCIRYIGSLEGIVNLIDSIQDYVVDELGMDANDVFLLNQEE